MSKKMTDINTKEKIIVRLAPSLIGLDNIKNILMKLAEEKGKGNILWPLRVSLSGKEKSPDPFNLVYILGREVTIKRIESVVSKLSK